MGLLGHCEGRGRRGDSWCIESLPPNAGLLLPRWGMPQGMTEDVSSRLLSEQWLEEASWLSCAQDVADFPKGLTKGTVALLALALHYAARPKLQHLWQG